MWNVAFDFFVGLFPVIGDILDIGYKGNSCNATLLVSYLRKSGDENIRRDVGARAAFATSTNQQHYTGVALWISPGRTQTNVTAMGPSGPSKAGTASAKPTYIRQPEGLQKAIGGC